MAIKDFNCVGCGELFEADHMDAFNNFGIIYCDTCRAAGAVNGEMDDKEDQRSAESFGHLIQAFLKKDKPDAGS